MGLAETVVDAPKVATIDQIKLPATTLYFTDPSVNSDKEYTAWIAQSSVNPPMYQVRFRYGKRGGTQKDGLKTAKSVTWLEAKQVYTDLIEEKKSSKGYTENISGKPWTRP